MEICNTYFKMPVMFTLLAYVVNKALSYFTINTQYSIYNYLAKTVSMLCFTYYIYEAFIHKTITIKIEALAWFVDLVMSVVALTIISGYKYQLIELLLNPTKPLLDIIYANRYVVFDKSKLYFTAIVESFLWIPIVYIWSQDHCFIDGLIDMSTPLGIYSTTMISIMYMVLVPNMYVENTLWRIVLYYLSFYNTNYAIVAHFLTKEF